MNRDALIVGINKYPFFKVNGKVQNLTTPANDAEKIAHILETKGEFRVRRLPVKLREGNHQIDSDSTLNKQELQDAIGQLFNPEGENAPHTALLYFIGHGLREVSYGVTEGFLATSDVNPGRNQWGVRLKWLRELLQKSPVKEQIIWLDCCYAGELFNFTEADLGTGNKEQTRFFIAASREYELAEANVFSRTLLAGLNPNNYPEGLVNNDTLISYLKEHLKNAPQQPIFANPSQQILLTGTQGETIFTRIDGDCPYKGLLFFDVDDADYFYGRERLTQELIDKVQVGKANFLAVLGVSGSGKSSLLRAGLIYQLQHKDRLPQTQSWKIGIFTPGEKPLDSLAIAFLEKEWTDGQRYEELQRVKRAIDKGATRFADYINVSQAPRTLLIVDQFEEVFTVCKSPQDRNHFITTLLGALPETGDKLCLIFAMRDDFLGKCAAYQELAILIQSNLLMVTPMNEGELRDAIEKPATKLGRKVEHNLIDVILKDLRVESSGQETPEAEPGLLPLLSYTLEQLWYRQILNWLRLESYKELGGVRKILENLEEEAYKELSETEQRIADRIFIKLTNLGEGTPDTRKQVSMDTLVSLGESEEIVEQVVQKLANARLIVTHNLSVRDYSKSQEKKNVIVIDVAHEALIRYWGRLQELLENNRDAIRTEGKIQTAAEEWLAQGKPKGIEGKGYLLEGLKLVQAEETLQHGIEVVPLSDLAKELIKESREESKRLEQEEVKRRSVNRLVSFVFVGIVSVLVSIGFIASRQYQLTQLRKNIARANTLTITEPRKALALSIQVSHQSLSKSPQITSIAQSSLINALTTARELNVFRGHQGPVIAVAFSSDNQTIASSGKDGKICLWKIDKEKCKVLTNHDSDIRSIAFSPTNSNILIGGDKKGKIYLWNIEQGKSQLLGNHQGSVNDIAFNPKDSNLFVSVGDDGKIKLWNIRNKTFSIIGTRQGRVRAVAFNPNGETVAVGGDGKSLRLWNIKTINEKSRMLGFGDEDDVGVGCITSIAFNQGTIVTSSAMAFYPFRETLEIWDLNLEKIESPTFTIEAHEFSTYSVVLSFDSNLLISGGDDANIKLWNPSNGNLITKFIGHQRDTQGYKNRCHSEDGYKSISSLAFSPNDQFIVSGGSDKTVRLWSVNPFPERKTMKIVQQGQRSSALEIISPVYEEFNSRIVFFKPDGSQIELLKKDNTLIWHDNEQESEPIQFLSNIPHRLMVYSPDGNKIAVVDTENKIQIFDRDGNSLGKQFNLQVEPKLIALSFNSNAVGIVSQSNVIEIRDFNGNQIGLPFQHEGEVDTIALNPDNSTLVTVDSVGFGYGGGNSQIYLWSIEGTQIAKFEWTGALVNDNWGFLTFSPSGNSIIGYSYVNSLSVKFLPGNLSVWLDIACQRLTNYLIADSQDSIEQEAKKICRENYVHKIEN